MSNDLNKLLNQQAEILTPEFDESLHVRTMARLNQARRARASAAVHVDPDTVALRLRRLLLRSSIAATMLVALFVVHHFATRPTAEDLAEWNRAIAALRETADPIEAQFRLPIDRAEQQITLLSDDAKAFGNFVAERLAVFAPEDESL